MPHPSAVPARNRSRWLVPAIVITAALALILAVIVMSREDTTPAGNQASVQGPLPQAQPRQPDFSVVEARVEGDPVALGDVDAPVGLVVFSDYQCPYCAKWSTDTLPAMMEHVDNGDLRIEWRELNIFGAESERGARAAYAAGMQDRYLDYHHALFADGKQPDKTTLDDAALIALAGSLGLDTAQFTSDYHSPTTAQAVADNAQIGIAVGANSTPSFILGGQPIMGAQPTEYFEQAFDTALAERG